MIEMAKASTWIRLSYRIRGAEHVRGTSGLVMQKKHDCSVDTELARYSFTSLGDVDRLGLRFCEDPFGSTAVESIQEYRRFRMRCLATSLGLLEMAGLPRCALMSVRLKRLDSIHRKIGRQSTNFTLGRLDDVVGFRVVCENVESVLELSQRIRSTGKFYREKNYLSFAHPANTGYRGIHLILRFNQALANKSIPVRFEVQVRTFLQHQWAIWSESHGEATKIGLGDRVTAKNLQVLSERIAIWESCNASVVQKELPNVQSIQNVVVVWSTNESSQPFIQFFDVHGDDAVEWLRFLETEHPLRRTTALLLVGISEPEQALEVLRVTHPLYTGNRVLEPHFWMPIDS